MKIEKNLNENYDFWDKNIEKNNKSLNKKEISKFFSNHFLLNTNFKAWKNIGFNSINKYTINNLIFSLNNIFKNGKNIFISFSNFLDEYDEEILTSIKRINNINIYSTKNLLSSSGLNQHISKNEKFKYSIHFENNNDYYNIYILNSKGELLNIDGTSLLIDEYKNNNNFINKDDFINKIIEVKEKYFTNYEEEIKNKFTNILDNNKNNNEKILLNVNSDFNEILFKSFIPENENLIFLLNNKQIFDIEKIESFRFAYKFANTNKINNIINISAYGDKLMLATKKRGVWKFWKSVEIFALLMKSFSNINKKNKFDLVVKKENEVIEKISKYFSIPLDKNNYNFIFDDNYCFKFKNNNSFISDSILLTKILLNEFLNSDYLIDTLEDLNKNLGYFYSTFKIIDKDIRENFFLEILNSDEDLSQIKIKKYEIISENKNVFKAQIKTNIGEVDIFYNKVTKKLSLSTYTFGNNKDDVFYKNRNFEKEIIKIINEENKDKNMFETKKGVFRIFLIFGFFILMSFVVFYTLFDIETLKIAFAELSNSYNTVWFYILVSKIFMAGAFKGIILYLIFRKISSKTKFKDIYISSVFSTFISLISPTYLLGTISQVWYLRKKSYNSAAIVPTLLLYYTFMGLFGLTTNLILIIWGSIFLNTQLGSYSSFELLYTVMIWIGFLWVSFSLAWTLILSFSKKIHFLIFLLIEKALFLVKFEGKYIKINDELEFNSTKIRSNLFSFLKKNKTTVLSLFVIFIIFMFYESYALMSTFNIILPGDDMYNVFDFMLIDTIVSFTNVISPMPGSTLTTELMMKDIYTSFLTMNGYPNPGEYASEISFMYRVFSYYLIVMVISIPSMGILLVNMIKKKEVKVENV